MPVTVEKIETPADDASLNATRVRYTADSGLSPTVQSLGVDVYLSSMDLKISARGDKAAASIQQALGASGMEAQITSPAENTDMRILTVRNSDPSAGVIRLVTALAKLGEKPGSISREVADQIVEMERGAIRASPEDFQLASITTQQASSGFAGKARPNAYVKSSIYYELSPVTYLEEDSRFTASGGERFTRMGVRDAESALVFKALTQEGIKSKIVMIDNDRVTHAEVEASAGQISKALELRKLLLPSIAEEIQQASVRARIEQTNPQQAGSRSA